ncbi:MAG: hypothetical protein NUV81_02185 [bacterium]|nr:hypothetical protein [bacterium]
MGRGSSSEKSLGTLFRLPAFLIVNIALFSAIGFSLARQSYRGWHADREMSSLENEVNQLEGRKLRLEALTQQLVSSEHVELEARSRLGKQLPGERVVVLYGRSATDTWTGEDIFGDIRTERTPVVNNRSNIQKWWDYFSSKE